MKATWYTAYPSCRCAVNESSHILYFRPLEGDKNICVGNDDGNPQVSASAVKLATKTPSGSSVLGIPNIFPVVLIRLHFGIAKY